MTWRVHPLTGTSGSDSARLLLRYRACLLEEVVPIVPPRALFVLLLLFLLTTCNEAADEEGRQVIVFRCIDQRWFTVRASNLPDEIVIWQPGRMQVRLQRIEGRTLESWRYRAGGYTLVGAGRRAFLVEENRLPVQCTAQEPDGI